MTVENRDPVSIFFRLPFDYHARCRHAAVSQGESMAAYIRRVVRDAIDRDWPDGAKKSPKEK